MDEHGRVIRITRPWTMSNYPNHKTMQSCYAFNNINQVISWGIVTTNVYVRTNWTSDEESMKGHLLPHVRCMLGVENCVAMKKDQVWSYWMMFDACIDLHVAHLGMNLKVFNHCLMCCAHRIQTIMQILENTRV